MTISQSNPTQLHGSGEGPGRLISIEPDRRLEAVLRLVATGSAGDRAAAERFIHYAGANGIQLDAMWGREGRQGRIIETVLAVPGAGRTAMIFASAPQTPDLTGSLGLLIDHVARSIGGPTVHLAQMLLEPEETQRRDAAQLGGFSQLAELSYLERPLSRPRVPAEPTWPDGVTVEPFRASRRDELMTTLSRSYEQTLDCPGLYGLRDIEDVLEGHQSTGEFDPALWTLMRVEGEVAGMILLNPFPAQRIVELVYLGLVPEARGRGLGSCLLRHGLRQLASRRERSVTLAVDERNEPALALYAAEGFTSVVRRVALIRSLRGSDGDA